MMLRRSAIYTGFATLLVISFFCSVLSVFAGEQYERASEVKASSFLPEEFLNNTLYSLEDTAKNDGFVNTYTLHFGSESFQAASNLALYKLISEIEAIDAMKKVQESDAFINSLKESGVATVDGLKKLFTDPSDTLENAASGLSSLFSRAEESIFNSSPGETEDSRFEQTVGFSSAKREVAFRYNVDVYSKNALLQEHLDRIAWAEYAGSLTLGVATMPVGGMAGVTLSVSGTARLLGEVIATTPPAELKLQNREKLAKMKIDKNLADLFIENPHFSPLQQTAYIMALEKITTAKERSLPLQVALQVNDQTMAGFMTAVMVMFAGYNDKIAPVTQFKTVARFFCGVDNKGKLIVILPADYITFNKRLASGIIAVKNETLAGFELWIVGTASPEAQNYLKTAGWQLVQNAAGKIGFSMGNQR